MSDCGTTSYWLTDALEGRTPNVSLTKSKKVKFHSSEDKDTPDVYKLGTTGGDMMPRLCSRDEEDFCFRAVGETGSGAPFSSAALCSIAHLHMNSYCCISNAEREAMPLSMSTSGDICDSGSALVICICSSLLAGAPSPENPLIDCCGSSIKNFQIVPGEAS